MPSSNCQAVSTSPGRRPALVASYSCAYVRARSVTVIFRFRCPAWMTTIAVMILVRLAIGRSPRRPRLHSTRPVRTSTRSPPAATIPLGRSAACVMLAWTGLPRTALAWTVLARYALTRTALALALTGLASRPQPRQLATTMVSTRRTGARMTIPSTRITAILPMDTLPPGSPTDALTSRWATAFPRRTPLRPECRRPPAGAGRRCCQRRRTCRHCAGPR